MTQLRFLSLILLAGTSLSPVSAIAQDQPAPPPADSTPPPPAADAQEGGDARNYYGSPLGLLFSPYQAAFRPGPTRAQAGP